MSHNAPGYTHSLPKLVAARNISGAGAIQLDLSAIGPRKNSNERRLQQALVSVFADGPGSALGMVEQMRLVLASRERIASGARLM